MSIFDGIYYIIDPKHNIPMIKIGQLRDGIIFFIITPFLVRCHFCVEKVYVVDVIDAFLFETWIKREPLVLLDLDSASQNHLSNESQISANEDSQDGWCYSSPVIMATNLPMAG